MNIASTAFAQKHNLTTRAVSGHGLNLVKVVGLCFVMCHARDFVYQALPLFRLKMYGLGMWLISPN